MGYVVKHPRVLGLVWLMFVESLPMLLLIMRLCEMWPKLAVDVWRTRSHEDSAAGIVVAIE